MPSFVMNAARKRSAPVLGSFGAAVLVAAFLLLGALAPDARAARVLVLHSYHQGLPWTDGMRWE